MIVEPVETILVFAANPRDQPLLSLDWELRAIHNALRNSRKRFDVKPHLAVTPDDLRQALLDHNPTHIHFCGHGTGEAGIILEGQTVTADALAELFRLFAQQVKCVVLNACYSAVQAQAIVRYIEHVVGMKQTIRDDSAVVFAKAYYQALGAGKPVPFAFAIGCNALQMGGLSEYRTPELLTRDEPPDDRSLTPVYSSRRDWDGAPAVSLLYGREKAAEVLKSWILDEACRVVLIIGLGGIGKSDLAASLGRGGIRTTTSPVLTEGIQGNFDVVLWRSLLNAPLPDELFADIAGVLSDHEQSSERTPEQRLADILLYLQSRRCLVILDNVESVLRSGDPAMHYRDGYERYGTFFELIARSAHQSCLLLTSREKPRPIPELEGALKPVRSLALAGIGPADSQNIFAQIGSFEGSDAQWTRIAQLYGGNPLALELVARHVEQVFDGDLSAFLNSGRSIFADVEEVLDWHLDRLSEGETELVNWLAIERDPVTRDTLEADLLSPVSRDRLPSTLQSVQRRIPLERVIHQHFALQPVLIERLTARLISRMSAAFAAAITEVVQRRPFDPHRPSRVMELLRQLNTHSLVKATAKENIREAQQRLIIAPLAEQLAASRDIGELRYAMLTMVDLWRQHHSSEPGYAIGNIINLLSHLKIDLHAMDFSRLRVWRALLHDINLHGANFSFCDFRDTVFRYAFGAAFSIGYSPDGQFIAVGDDNGEIRLFFAANGQLHMRCRGHSDVVSAVAFRADGQLMASASYDNMIRLWNTADGRCVHVLTSHKGWVYSLAFSPDGRTLASASEDGTCRVWDLQTFESVVVAAGEQAFVAAVAFSPDSDVLAVGGSSGVVNLFRVSDLQTAIPLHGHSGRIRSLAFSKQGDLLASGAEDRKILLWQPANGELLGTLTGHSGTVLSLSFSEAGDLLASGSDDQTVRLWSTARRECVGQLHGSPSRIWAVACSPTSRTVASAGEDSAVRVWDLDSRQCLITLRGYSNKTWAVAYCPDSGYLAAGNEDSLVRIWDVFEGRNVIELRGHSSRVWTVACSANGDWIASGSDDLTVRIWGTKDRASRRVLRGHDDWIRCVTFSPDSRFVASAAEDGRILIWDLESGDLRLRIDSGMPRVFSITFCDANVIAAGGADSDIHLYSVLNGTELGTFGGHDAWLTTVVSLDPSALASCSEDGTVRIFDIASKACSNKLVVGHKVWCGAAADKGKLFLCGSEDGMLRRWDLGGRHGNAEVRAHQGSVWALAVNQAGDTVATAGDDGVIRTWQLPSLAPAATANGFRSPRPYEGMNITATTGLTAEQKISLAALGAIEFPSA